MEIECPDRAVAVWTEGEMLCIRFPDRQLIEIPAMEPLRLINVLRMREQAELKREKMTVATPAAPTQLMVFDAYKEAVNKQKAAEREEKRKKSLLKRANDEWAAKEADKLLKECGL